MADMQKHEHDEKAMDDFHAGIEHWDSQIVGIIVAVVVILLTIRKFCRSITTQFWIVFHA